MRFVDAEGLPANYLHDRVPRKQFRFFTDTASKFGLAKVSPRIFRNTVDEPAMYQLIVKYMNEKRPDLKTVAVDWEPDFVHSSLTWKLIIKPTMRRQFTSER